MEPLNSAKLKQFARRTYSKIRNSRVIDGVYDQWKWIKDEYIKIMKILRLIGLGRFLKRLIYSRYEEVLLEIDLNKVASFPSKHTLNVYSIERKHMPRLESFRAQSGIEGNDPAYGYEYLDHGFKGFLAEHEGEIIGYIWWGDSKSDFSLYPQGCGFYVNELVTLGVTNTFSFDLYIAPRYRGNSIASEFIVNCFYVLRDQGFIKNYGYVHSDNIAARWLYRIIGFKDLKKVIIRRFFLFFLFKKAKYYFDDGIKWLTDTREIYTR